MWFVYPYNWLGSKTTLHLTFEQVTTTEFLKPLQYPVGILLSLDDKTANDCKEQQDILS